MKVITPRGPGATPHTFDPRELVRMYRRVPPMVFADLAIQGFDNASTFDPDPRVHALNEGKRALWLHIKTMAKLSAEQLEDIYEGRGQALLTDEELFDG